MNELPNEILEFILAYLPPYDDFLNCRLVCKRWNQAIQNVSTSLKSKFLSAISECNIVTTTESDSTIKNISWRFGHSSCRLHNFIYVFGGATLSSTYLNDLWRFDLSTREWTRILAKGSYPPPMAFATLIQYHNYLYLFGSTHEEFHYHLFVSSNFRHFDVEKNEWKCIVTLNDPPPLMRHSATVHRDQMVVFGGFFFGSEVYRQLSNDVYTYNFTERGWHKVDIVSVKPKKRYGQTQIYLDCDHLMIIGGFNDSKLMFQDFWILNMAERNTHNWFWTQIFVSNPQVISKPEFLFANSFTRVHDYIVALARDPRTACKKSKSTKESMQFSSLPNQLVLNTLRVVDYKKFKSERRKFQLNKLEKFEERLKLYKKTSISEPYLNFYVLDIKNVLKTSSISWIKFENNHTDIEDLDEFSLIHGTNELLIIGGKRANINHSSVTKNNNECVKPKHFLSIICSPKLII